MFMRQLLSTMLVTVLAVPGWAGSGSVAGTVGTSQAATVRGAGVLPGTTIFNGDLVEVGAKGDAAISFGRGSMARLGEETSIRVLKFDNGIALELSRGRISFRSSEQLPVETRLADASIRSANGLAAVGVLAIRSATSAMIYAVKGTLLVSTAHDSRSATVREGESVEIRLGPAAEPYVTPSGTPEGGATSPLTPPVVDYVDPAGPVSDNCKDVVVTARFRKAMNPSTINTGTFLLAAGTTPVTGTVALDSAGLVATFTPSRPLRRNTAYTATISTGAQDVSGNGLAQDLVWKFNTPPIACGGPMGISAKNWAIVATIIGAATLAVGLGISANENRLNCPQKINLVSPFKLTCP